MNTKGLLMLPIEQGLICDYHDGNYGTLVHVATQGHDLLLPDGYTHFGLIISGETEISYLNRSRRLYEEDFFSVAGTMKISSNGVVVVISAKDYIGSNLFGGPIEEAGKLRYINGCTDTLLVAPVRKGDPCFNHLHFPPHTVQTPHTHPSVRINIVLRGSGVCLVPEDDQERVSLVKGYVFVMKTETMHSFDTEGDYMDVITFHPDSDTGMTDDDHPMVNRTIVDGQSASNIKEIRT